MKANFKYNKSTGELTIVDKDGEEMSVHAEITSDTPTRVLFYVQCDVEDDFSLYPHLEPGVDDGD